MNTNSGISIEWLDDPPRIHMIWSHQVSEKDVQEAFASIQTLLDSGEEPISVLVDLSANPNFPLVATFQNALAGPYRHKRLSHWLIIEPQRNRWAHMAETLLSSATGRRNVYWFLSQEQALAFIIEQHAASAPQKSSS